MCSEWDWRGLPYWLMNKDVDIRTSDEQYMKYVKRYFEQLAKQFVPYLSTNGGPIIAVAVENEYGSFGDDSDYIKTMGDLLIELGVDVPLFIGNGVEPFKMQAGSRPEYWTGIDLHQLSPEGEKSIRSYQPNKPMVLVNNRLLFTVKITFKKEQKP